MTTAGAATLRKTTSTAKAHADQAFCANARNTSGVVMREVMIKGLLLLGVLLAALAAEPVSVAERGIDWDEQMLRAWK